VAWRGAVQCSAVRCDAADELWRLTITTTTIIVVAIVVIVAVVVVAAAAAA
jgi:heme/copper-type cytochrome/quinol oxidase subunit 2